jgi:hypothetical protein
MTHLRAALDSISDSYLFKVSTLKDNHDSVVLPAIRDYFDLVEKLELRRVEENRGIPEANARIDSEQQSLRELLALEENRIGYKIEALRPRLLQAQLDAASAVSTVGQAYSPENPQRGIRIAKDPVEHGEVQVTDLQKPWTALDWALCAISGVTYGLSIGSITGQLDLSLLDKQIPKLLLFGIAGFPISVGLKRWMEATSVMAGEEDKEGDASRRSRNFLLTLLGSVAAAALISTLFDQQGLLAIRNLDASIEGVGPSAGTSGGPNFVGLLGTALAAAVIAVPYIASCAAMGFKNARDRLNRDRVNAEMRSQRADAARREREDTKVQSALSAANSVAVLQAELQWLEGERQRLRSDYHAANKRLEAGRRTPREGFTDAETAKVDWACEHVIGLCGRFSNMVALLGDEVDPGRFWNELKNPGLRWTVKQSSIQRFIVKHRMWIWILIGCFLLFMLGLAAFLSTRGGPS